MNTNKSKSNKIQLKSNDSIEFLEKKSSNNYLFQPIISTDQRKSPSSFQTGFKYLKFLGQNKRQNENISINNIQQIKSPIINRLERTTAFLTNYYASLSKNSINKSIQVDDFDELSYKTAINNNYTYLSLYEFLFIFISILFFILIILYFQLNSYPIHCILNKKFWYPINLSNGFQCEYTNIEIYYIEIYSKIYQIEIQKNLKSLNCLGFDIISCLPIDYFLIPNGQIIYRNNQLMKYCNHTKKINCQNSLLNILPYQTKWNLKNNQFNILYHCSCLMYKNNTNCFHFMINNQCNLQIPWFNYCLKYSTVNSTCSAYIK